MPTLTPVITALMAPASSTPEQVRFDQVAFVHTRALSSMSRGSSYHLIFAESDRGSSHWSGIQFECRLLLRRMWARSGWSEETRRSLRYSSEVVGAMVTRDSRMFIVHARAATGRIPPSFPCLIRHGVAVAAIRTDVLMCAYQSSLSTSLARAVCSTIAFVRAVFRQMRCPE